MTTLSLFDVFATFMYTGQISIARITADGKNEYEVLLWCWFLGDKILSGCFKDAVVDAMCESMTRSHVYPTFMQNYIYPHSSVPSGLKRLAVDVAVLRWTTERLVRTGQNAQLPELGEFFAQTTMRAFETSLRERKKERPWADAGCKYHEHGDGQACYKTLFEAIALDKAADES